MAIQSRWAASRRRSRSALAQHPAQRPWIAASPCGLLARTGVVIANREATWRSRAAGPQAAGAAAAPSPNARRSGPGSPRRPSGSSRGRASSSRGAKRRRHREERSDVAIQSRWAASRRRSRSALAQRPAQRPCVAASPFGLLARTGVFSASREAPSSSRGAKRRGDPEPLGQKPAADERRTRGRRPLDRRVALRAPREDGRRHREPRSAVVIVRSEATWRSRAAGPKASRR
ncbi:hypothetical protein DFR50_11351 [Roseiarcus fermentans]|uniref:Uncharacterized protein n=1 Tax=Roseiarcus fermentans TaxID=1473586 RepID=A0A366FDV7_9HYPH|nr:hypothetical protein DFR50_11351 [Roseiarcus fermentans]